ncbi:MAG: ferrochelatase [Planctomycetaceae bacterium]|nr:ferrochelatase [Planctomycetaceae bacterium]
MEDVIPFLENVLRGKNVPRERMLEVAHHYELFGGVSPINQQMRDLLAALKPALKEAGISLPVYWGNRNWTPYLNDTMAEMTKAGVKRALCLMVSAYSSYSGCRQYRENVQSAQQNVGAAAPACDKLRVFYNHPLFIEACVDRLRVSLEKLPPDLATNCRIAFTAHSLPMSMARTSDYQKQLEETVRLVCEELEISPERSALVYQSRSGRPEDPWLEPDILDHLKALHEQGCEAVVMNPIGFLSDHMEVMYDLDQEAVQLCEELGLRMVRTGTVGTHPAFISMLVELIQERMDPSLPKRAIGQYPPNHDVCPVDCCPAPRRPAPKS